MEQHNQVQSQPEQVATNKSNKKILKISAVALLLLLVGYGLYSLKTRNYQKIAPISDTIQSGRPGTSIRPNDFSLATVWQKGTTQYSNPNIDVTFQYPESFTTTVNASNSTSTVTDSSLPKLMHAMIINTPDVPIEAKNSSGFDFTTYNTNTMQVNVDVYENARNQSLDDFLNTLYADPGTDGKISTITTLRKNLTPSNQPKPGSYLYVGTLGENPMKAYYFTDRDKVYVIRLFGGNNTGDLYTKDAEAVFTNIINSINFN